MTRIPDHVDVVFRGLVLLESRPFFESFITSLNITVIPNDIDVMSMGLMCLKMTFVIGSVSTALNFTVMDNFFLQDDLLL